MFFYFGLVSGFVVGLWVVFCAILFKRSWRVAYFRQFDKLYDKAYVFVAITWTITGLRRPSPRRYLRDSGIGIDSAYTSSSRLAHFWLDHPFKRVAKMISATDRHRARVYAIKLWVAATAAARGPPLLAVGTLRDALLSVPHCRWSSRRCIDMSCSCVVFSDRSFAAFIIFLAVCELTTSSSALVMVSRSGSSSSISSTATASPSCHYRRSRPVVQLPLHGYQCRRSCRWSCYFRRRISLDYISLFSGNCALLRQFSLYAVLAPRPSRKPSLLVSSDIGV
uniref:Uncharacterized protein n=1 Tax=Oryza barthii TaxID=65489 RepID=A0A0D3HPI5_9ORYZ